MLCLVYIISLANNILTKIHPHVFANTKDDLFVEISLNHNKISYIGEGSFNFSAKSLIRLDHNEIASVPLKAMSSHNAKYFKITVDPWHCDCNMKWSKIGLIQ